MASDIRAFGPDVAIDMRPMTEQDARTFVDTFAGVAARAVVISSSGVYRAYGRLNETEPRPPDRRAAKTHRCGKSSLPIAPRDRTTRRPSLRITTNCASSPRPQTSRDDPASWDDPRSALVSTLPVGETDARLSARAHPLRAIRRLAAAASATHRTSRARWRLLSNCRRTSDLQRRESRGLLDARALSGAARRGSLAGRDTPCQTRAATGGHACGWEPHAGLRAGQHARAARARYTEPVSSSKSLEAMIAWLRTNRPGSDLPMASLRLDYDREDLVLRQLGHN
jgi:hypothetical protein